MVNICACAGCSNSTISGHRTHFFPKRGTPAFRAWVRFVQVKRADFTASSVKVHSCLCSEHFKEDDYIQGDLMEHRMGFRSLSQVRLISGAVPSIQPQSQAAEASTSRGSTAQLKLGLARTLQSLSGGPGVEEPMLQEEVQEEDLPVTDSVPPCEPYRESTGHKSTQCSVRKPHRSLGIQVFPQMLSMGTQAAPKMVSVETQTDISGFAESSSQQSQCTQSSQSGSEQSAPNQVDEDWVPGPEDELFSDSSDVSDPEPLSSPCIIDKYVVCHSQLMMLFATCPICSEATQGIIQRQEGTFIKIQQVCSACGFKRPWQNQPFLHRNMPACNLQLSGAIHFAGCMPQQTLRMLKLFGLQCISSNTYFRHQRYYTVPTISQAWQSQQADIIRELKAMDGGLILSGDCRSDSPGHCAKYGSYSLIDDRLNKLVDLQLVQSSEVRNSNWCEIEGLQRSIKFLKEQDLKVAVLVTDRNRQVAKWVRDDLCKDGTLHFFDIWHVGKSLNKQLDALSRERGCEEVKLWQRSLVNHLYWTAASTPSGNADMMEAKWRSLVNHVQDIHEHNTPAFPVCQHGDLEEDARNKEWLEPGSTAAVRLEELTTKKTFINDVRQLSPKTQTYSLEAFHSLVIKFCPKHTGFSYLGMHSRLLLAAMHYNHNGNRPQATTAVGTPRYSVAYPRFRKGEPVVHPIKEKPSYDYAVELMASLKEQYARSPTALRALSERLATAAPAPVAQTFQQVDKTEAVSRYQAHTSRFCSGHVEY